MSILVIAEHDNNSLKGATLNTNDKVKKNKKLKNWQSQQKKKLKYNKAQK
jgi:hypothetical protein